MERRDLLVSEELALLGPPEPTASEDGMPVDASTLVDWWVASARAVRNRALDEERAELLAAVRG